MRPRRGGPVRRRTFGRIAATSAVAVLLLAQPAVAAKAPECGSRGDDGSPVLGALTLNDNSSAVKSYGPGRGDRHLTLVFDVAGCTLPAGMTIQRDQVSLMAAKTGDDLPAGVVHLTVQQPDATSIAVDAGLSLEEIAPGTQGAIVRVHDPGYLQDSFTPIAVSRTDSWHWAVVFGFFGALAGFIWAIGLHVADTVPPFRFVWWHWAILTVLVLGAGVVAGYGYWLNQDVWTVHANALATAAAGFTASTTGALLTVTTALVSQPKTRTQPVAPAAKPNAATG